MNQKNQDPEVERERDRDFFDFFPVNDVVLKNSNYDQLRTIFQNISAIHQDALPVSAPFFVVACRQVTALPQAG